MAVSCPFLCFLPLCRKPQAGLAIIDDHFRRTVPYSGAAAGGVFTFSKGAGDPSGRGVQPLRKAVAGLSDALLLAIIVRLAQQRTAFQHKALGVVTKPVLHFAEAVDKGLFISLLKQFDCLTEALVIALNQRHITF